MINAELCEELWESISFTDQEDLNEWYNTRNLGNKEKARLATLFLEGRFHAYDCGHCGERVRQGNPESWDHFQGVCQDEGYGELCANCYCLYERLKDLAGD